QLDVLGCLRYCVVEGAADAGQAELADSRAIAAIFDDQHALRTCRFVRDQSADELVAIGAFQEDARWGGDGLHLESVVARGQCGVLPVNFMGKLKAALASV